MALTPEMDIQLPVKDGIQATKEIRQYEKAHGIGVFALTPSSEQPRPILAASMTELQSRRSRKERREDGHSSGDEPVASASNDTLPPEPLATPFRSPVIIVALTASSLQSDRHTALAAGCNDFLTKPVSLVWLERKIMEWGCMQALIDFEGWRRWRGGTHATDRAAAAAGGGLKNLAESLRIEKTGTGLVGRRSRLKREESLRLAQASATTAPPAAEVATS